MADIFQFGRSGMGNELVGAPRRTRHCMDYTGVTIPSPDTDNYASSPVELATSEPQSATFTHSFDSDEFYYPKLDGTQLGYLPYGHFRAICWLAVKNDNASSATVSLKVETVINGDSRKTPSSASGSSIASGYYNATTVTWHPWAFGTGYYYRYTGFAPGDSLKLYVWASLASVKVHYVCWALVPAFILPTGGSNEGNLNVAWPHSDGLWDLRSTSPVNGPSPSIFAASDYHLALYPGGSTYWTTVSSSTNLGLGYFGSSRDTAASTQVPAPLNHVTGWFTGSSASVQSSSSASAFSNCSAMRYNLVGPLYYTPIPGRAALTQCGGHATNPG